jgi:hypothetical protein
MATVITAGAFLVLITTVFHYEVLRLLSFSLPMLRVPPRARLLFVIFTAFLAHGIQILLYAVMYDVLTSVLALGGLQGSHHPSMVTFLYFSAETYTSLGFGDISPVGPMRLLTGVESLNGLLLIGWSASYTYLAMERFWTEPKNATRSAPRPE